MNSYAPHVYVIPEDDADRQIAGGFVLHHNVDSRRIQVMPVAGGWPNVLTTFQGEYIQTLHRFPKAHVVLLIDFDGDTEERRARFETAIPDELKPRVFVVGSKDTPETLKKLLKRGFEKIGESLAKDCDEETTEYWSHDQLEHNDAERERLVQIVKPFLFSM